LRKISDDKFLPYPSKTWRLYLFLAIIAIVLTLFFDRQLIEFFISRSRLRAILLFFLMPLLGLLTRPYGKERAIGMIYAINEKEWSFFPKVLFHWLVFSTGSFLVAFMLYTGGYYAVLVSFANTIYCFFFLAFLVNLFPTPPPNIRRGAQLPISVWGARQCGKTVYIGMLYNDLCFKKWKMEIIEDEAASYIISIRSSLANNQWPQDTQPTLDSSQAAQSFTFNFYRKRIWGPYFGMRYFSISFPDPSGELFLKVEGVKTSELPAFKQEYFQSLHQSAGALFIISIQDAKNPETLKRQLEANLTHLQFLHFPSQPGRKLDFPVAIAVSQVDRLYDGYKQYHHQPEEWFKRLFGEVFYRMLQGRLFEFKIFYFSAIGVKEVNGRMVPRTSMVDGMEVPDKKLQPFGLFQPIQWLLKRSKRYMRKQKK